ncbi:hypothetical protein PR048_030807 [Dryococelus australis]|uniref:Uncharacterized protein n=1 Tax=Dryococelus australis TaxID=614101 RepID=A0ABQ9G9Y4_9NEOP|nr:hypothetical protein PR048_030807 [Dryococelus australis]
MGPLNDMCLVKLVTIDVPVALLDSGIWNNVSFHRARPFQHGHSSSKIKGGEEGGTKAALQKKIMFSESEAPFHLARLSVTAAHSPTMQCFPRTFARYIVSILRTCPGFHYRHVSFEDSFGNKLDSTILCVLEPQYVVHWLMLQVNSRSGCTGFDRVFLCYWFSMTPYITWQTLRARNPLATSLSLLPSRFHDFLSSFLPPIILPLRLGRQIHISRRCRRQYVVRQSTPSISYSPITGRLASSKTFAECRSQSASSLQVIELASFSGLCQSDVKPVTRASCSQSENGYAHIKEPPRHFVSLYTQLLCGYAGLNDTLLDNFSVLCPLTTRSDENKTAFRKSHRITSTGFERKTKAELSREPQNMSAGHLFRTNFNPRWRKEARRKRERKRRQADDGILGWKSQGNFLSDIRVSAFPSFRDGFCGVSNVFIDDSVYREQVQINNYITRASDFSLVHGSYLLEKQLSCLTGPLRTRQHRHGSYVIRVHTVNTMSRSNLANQDRLDSTILCTVESQMFVHWLLIQCYHTPGSMGFTSCPIAISARIMKVHRRSKIILSGLVKCGNGISQWRYGNSRSVYKVLKSTVCYNLLAKNHGALSILYLTHPGSFDGGETSRWLAAHETLGTGLVSDWLLLAAEGSLLVGLPAGGQVTSHWLADGVPTLWHCSSESIIYIQNSITPLDCQRIKEYATLSEDCEAGERRGMRAVQTKNDLHVRMYIIVYTGSEWVKLAIAGIVCAARSILSTSHLYPLTVHLSCLLHVQGMQWSHCSTAITTGVGLAVASSDAAHAMPSITNGPGPTAPSGACPTRTQPTWRHDRLRCSTTIVDGESLGNRFAVCSCPRSHISSLKEDKEGESERLSRIGFPINCNETVPSARGRQDIVFLISDIKHAIPEHAFKALHVLFDRIKVEAKCASPICETSYQSLLILRCSFVNVNNCKRGEYISQLIDQPLLERVLRKPLRVKRSEYGASPEYKGGVKRKLPEKTRRPVASSSTIPTGEKPGGDPAGNRTQFALVEGE